MGRFEIGVIILIPYLLDLGLRTRGSSLGQLITRLTGGIGKGKLALILITIELVSGVIAILLYL